jgi:hypothetical protein
MTTQKPSTSLLSLILIDVNENHEIGEFMKDQNWDHPAMCFVGETKCQSKEEWQKLIRPYWER